MAETLVVLWVFFTTPWQFGHVPMTVGWASMAVFHDAESCENALENTARRAECRPAGAEEPRPLAEIIRGQET